MQVHADRIEVVGPERADRAADIVTGVEHEVVDEELATAVEEICERDLAARPFEHVPLVDGLPRQVA